MAPSFRRPAVLDWHRSTIHQFIMPCMSRCIYYDYIPGSRDINIRDVYIVGIVAVSFNLKLPCTDAWLCSAVHVLYSLSAGQCRWQIAEGILFDCMLVGNPGPCSSTNGEEPRDHGYLGHPRLSRRNDIECGKRQGEGRRSDIEYPRDG